MTNMQSTRTKRNLTLKELRKKSESYYRGNAIIKKGRRRNKTIEYIVERTFEALPKSLRKYLEESKESIITNLTNQIVVYKDQDINPYGALMQMAKFAKRRTGDGTKEYIWSRFIHDYHITYQRFYHYMRSIGYKASDYWFENVEISQSGSIVYADCSLPNLGARTKYYTLEIEFNFSGDEMQAILY